jgi:hypothetical protein
LDQWFFYWLSHWHVLLGGLRLSSHKLLEEARDDISNIAHRFLEVLRNLGLLSFNHLIKLSFLGLSSLLLGLELSLSLSLLFLEVELLGGVFQSFFKSLLRKHISGLVNQITGSCRVSYFLFNLSFF